MKLENWGGLTVTRNWLGLVLDRNAAEDALRGNTRLLPTHEYLQGAACQCAGRV